MKNPFKIQPEEWAKEREIGQFSFILKQTIIFTLLTIPFCLLLNFVLDYFNEEWKIYSIIVSSVSGGIALAVSQWSNLESEYQKSIKNQSEQNQYYGKKEK